MGVESWNVRAVAPSGFSLGEMKQFVRNHFQAFVNDKDLTQAERSFSGDFLDHDEPTGIEVGIEAAKSMMQRAHAGWSDVHVKVRAIVPEDYRVIVQNAWTGTKARIQQRIEFEGFVLWRFASGKIVERSAMITPPWAISKTGAFGHE